MTEQVKICRMCLTLINNETPTELNILKHQMLRLVSPQSNVVLGTKFLLCEHCVECLQNSFDFKMTTISNEDYLNTFLSESTKVALKDILHKSNAIKREIKEENELICRLCFNYFDNEHCTDLSRIEDDLFLKDMIEKCLPEINLNTTRDSFMCNGCMQSLQNQFDLVSTLLDTNDKIDDYISHSGTSNNNEVDLNKVLEFVDGMKNRRTNDFSLVKVEEIKLENIAENIHIKEEEVVCLKEEQDWAESCKDEFVDEDVLEKNDRGMYGCAHCPHSTTTRDNLRLHLRTHSDAVQLRCDKCDFTTKWPASLYQHNWLHGGGKLYRCELCPYESRYRKHVRRHSKRHEAAAPPFRCKHCSFTTNVRSQLKLHGKKKHDRKEEFACDQCDFVTHRKSLLTQHSNTKHKKLVCEYCGFRSSHIWHLKNHMLKHRDEAEVPMFQCSICEFRTKYKNSLRTHLSTHVEKTTKKGKKKCS